MLLLSLWTRCSLALLAVFCADVGSSIFYQNPLNSAWIQLCGDGEERVEVKATECPAGVKLRRPTHLNCICAHGLWILRSDHEQGYLLLFGKGHCFDLTNISVQVHELRHIGIGPTDPFATSDFVIIGNSAAKLVDGERPEGTILRINPLVHWCDLDSISNGITGCTPTEYSGDRNDLESDHNHQVLLYKAWKKPGDGVQTPILTKPIQLPPGNYYIGHSGFVGGTSRKCKLSCKPNLLEFINAKAHKTRSRVKRSNPEDCPESYIQKGLSPDQREKLINEETERLIVANNAFTFHLIQGPKVSSVREWPVFQKVKEIFQAFCPQEHIPPFVLNSMVRMFRYLLAYSRDRFARGILPRHKKARVRWLETLSQCLESSLPSKLYFKEEMQCPRDSAGVAAYPEACTCSVTPEQVTLYRDENVTLTARHILPEHLQFRLPNNSEYSSEKGLDFPIETAWKMVLLVHYHCNPYFNNTPMDLSYIQMGLEQLFNDAIQYRWNHPGNSFEAYQRVFSNYDLKKFALATDTCVAIAKERAYYPRWIQRPQTRDREEPVRRRKRSLDIENMTPDLELVGIGSGQAHAACIR